MKGQTMKNKHRDDLAKTAMLGILTACSSPQYVEHLERECAIAKQDKYQRIAARSYNMADAMIAQSKRKG